MLHFYLFYLNSLTAELVLESARFFFVFFFLSPSFFPTLFFVRASGFLFADWGSVRSLGADLCSDRRGGFRFFLRAREAKEFASDDNLSYFLPVRCTVPQFSAIQAFSIVCL